MPLATASMVERKECEMKILMNDAHTPRCSSNSHRIEKGHLLDIRYRHRVLPLPQRNASQHPEDRHGANLGDLGLTRLLCINGDRRETRRKSVRDPAPIFPCRSGSADYVDVIWCATLCSDCRNGFGGISQSEQNIESLPNNTGLHDRAFSQSRLAS